MPKLRCIALLAALAIPLVSAAHNILAQGQAVPGCLSQERIGCGCSVRLALLACPAPSSSSRYHLHAGLADGSPLWMKLDGQEIKLKSTRAQSQSFTFAQGDSWKEAYVGNGISVEISYRPGKNTCPKVAPETCEYFDVLATVTIRRSKAQFARYEGIGACGC